MKNRKRIRRPQSLTLRLSLLFGITATVVFSGLGWFIESSIKRHFVAEDISELEVVAEAVEQALLTVSSEDDFAFLERRFDDILVGHHGASLNIASSGGQILYTSAGPNLSKITTSIKKANTGLMRSWNDGQHTFRVLTRYLHNDTLSGGLAYAIAIPIDQQLRFINGFRYTLWLLIAIGIVITSLVGWIAVRQGHAPLRKIVTQIRQISANELNTRLSPETVPRELVHLAISFNEMLARMEEAFMRLSNFSADIAHELRTPVTSLMTQTQVVLSQVRSVDEYREILYSNIEEYERMAQMIGDMLFLAQSDNGLCKPNNTKIDLAAEVRNLFDFYEALAEERAVRFELEGSAWAVGDPLMLRRALNNLIANAIRHTPSDKNVRVILRTSSSNETNIVVENPGTEIKPEHLPKLFDRFYRVDPSRQKSGTGLGLAIVKSIVEVHNGRIKATSTDGYTRFKIILPNVPEFTA